MRTSVIIAASCLLSLPAFPDEPAAQRDFGFQPLEIYEFENGTSDLLVEDINGDGLDDIIFSNNHVSRLEILIRRNDPVEVAGLPGLEDRFENRGVLVDQSIRTIRIADLNNDGRKDIATFGATLGLLIRYQNKDGAFGDAERIFIKDTDEVTTIQTGDLDGDQKVDIIVCCKKHADLHWNRPERSFQEKETLLFSDECRYVDLADINCDGITDLVFYSTTLRNPLRVRFGKGGGLYDTELPLDLPPRTYTSLIEFPDQPAQVGMVLRNRLACRIYGFAEKEQPPLLQAQETSPSRIGLEGTDKKDIPAWLTTDFNADGFGDLIVSAPSLNRLHLYHGRVDGLNSEPERIDTLSEVSHISQFGNGDLLVISRKEKIAGIHATGSLNTFPEIISASGDVLAGCAIAGTSRYWLVCKNEDGALFLSQTDRTGDQSIHPLDLNNEPNELLAFSLPDNQTGLLLFTPYDSPKLFLQNGPELTELSSESFRALTSPLIRSNIHLDNPGDGSRLTVATGSVARQFKWKDGQYKIIRQFNPENAAGKLAASTEYSLLDGSKGTLIYDQNSRDLIWFSSDDQTGKIHIPDADQTIFNLVQLHNKTHDTIILIDRTGLSEILSNGSCFTPVSEAEYVSPAEKPMLSYLRAVELGSPPRPMIAVVDPANRSLELLSRQSDELKTELVFEVYLSSDFVERQQNRGTEPHNLRSGDFNGDNIGDLVLLCQDKVLIYLGE
ncbi:FG-GAP repeat domain-containing protein [Tichowtungia aerotolerans]|uniref:VCBS repeat-containing protein n=1 Tax=Tichowtungia aerotolerans TaxID=2697043 RepID=A0A6P1MB21_9BACT|nr:VCBS repeat-containing protein [Tichowtungia aerotolerans]QHI69298.1 hypothetical protein GT409_07490 [Tichowtungia aerotolerans]